MAPDESAEFLEACLDQWEDSREQGENRAPEELCRENPALLAELKRRIRELEQLDRFLEPASDDAAHSCRPFIEIQAGRYRAKRLHAPGGLGEVFYANDDELNREVALKRLRPSIAWSREARRRFLLEAEITGRLEHPGVVPVYGLGKDLDGNPYYAMRFIRGRTLDQATEDLHASQDADPDQQFQVLKRLLHALKAACQTIAYAHDQGVVHRDIKPANIILGDYGEVLVIDWGLAKTLPTISNDSVQPLPECTSTPTTAGREETAALHLDATEAGQIKGTPAYMSPEQAEGNPATPASDIYGLGATLYKVLTGTAPYTGDSPQTVIDKVLAQDLLAPRQVKAAVPPALEAICLKAMQKNPQLRYATALEFAQDLGNWLDDIPTRAWPEPWALRTRRWMRKHRAVVVGTVTALCVVLLAASGWAIRERVLNNKLRFALQVAKEEQARAQFQATRADTNYQQARDAVQKMLFRTNDARWNSVPKLKQLQREQSEVALSFFETIAAQPGQDPRIQADIAWGLIEAGKLQIAMGKLAEGKAKLQLALHATEALFEEAKDDARVSMLRSDALLAHGAYLDASEGAIVIEKGVELLNESYQQRPDSPEIRDALINGLITLGGSLISKGDYSRAEPHLVRAVELCQEILKTSPDDTVRLAICARARVNLCAAYRQSHRSVEARIQHELAERDLERLFKMDPLDRQTIDGLSVLRVNGAYDLAANGKQAEAIAYVQLNTPMLEAALKREPDDADYRDRLYRTHGVASMFLRDIGKKREAAETWEKVAELADSAEKPLRLVEAIEFWIDAEDLPRAIVAARRAASDLPEMSPAALWNRQTAVLERLAKLVADDEQTPAEERSKLAAELRSAALSARARAGSSAIEAMFKNAIDYFRSRSP